MRRLLEKWAIPLSIVLHGSVVGAMVMNFEEKPKPVPSAPVSLTIPEPAVETVSEAKAPDPISAAPPPPPEMRAAEVPPEPIKAAPPPSPMVPVDNPPVIESKAVDAPVVAAMPPKVVQAKPKPAVVTEKKPAEEAPPMAAPPPPTKPVETAMAPSPIAAPPAKTEMQSSASGHAGPPPDFIGRLRSKLEQARRAYPRAAQLRRLEGTPHLRFTMDRRGKVLAWSIEQSSGYAILDQEAEAMLQRAQLPPFPDDMTDDQREFTIPVQFFLR